MVTEQSLTPASIKQKYTEFSVKAEKQKDGLIHFTITYRLPRPQYVVAHLEVRDGDTTIAQSDTPSFVRESSATFEVALSPKYLANSKFDLSWNAMGESGGQGVALPGGAIFHVRLEEFAKNAPAAKAE